MKSHDVRGPDVRLAVELAASSHRRDFDLKTPLYEEAGVRELWVLDLDRRIAVVFTQPSSAGYSERVEHRADAVLTPKAFPDISVRLADLF
jgi:Uma2 family endonuclease